MNKCEKCRFKDDVTNKCIAGNSPYRTLIVDEISDLAGDEGCDAIYSEVYEDNLKNNDVHTAELDL